MKKILIIIAVLMIAISANVLAQNDIEKNTLAKKQKDGILYYCPMKCEGEKTYTKPGKCPVCGMNLVEVSKTKTPKPQNTSIKNSNVKIVGEMKNVMMKGELWGTIDLDTISNKQHLYGFGPVEYQTGEIMIIDGKSYKSTIVSNKELEVTETYKMKAPFFAYDNITNWEEVEIPDTVLTMLQLESFLGQITVNRPRPFFFKLNAIADSATIHVVNLPEGIKVSSPMDAHIGQRNFDVKNEPVELLGFFSTEHKMIFTHHDSFIHIHLITGDKKKMGHLDKLKIKKRTAILYLPKY